MQAQLDNFVVRCQGAHQVPESFKDSWISRRRVRKFSNWRQPCSLGGRGGGASLLWGGPVSGPSIKQWWSEKDTIKAA